MDSEAAPFTDTSVRVRITIARKRLAEIDEERNVLLGLVKAYEGLEALRRKGEGLIQIYYDEQVRESNDPCVCDECGGDGVVESTEGAWELCGDCCGKGDDREDRNLTTQARMFNALTAARLGAG